MLYVGHDRVGFGHLSQLFSFTDVATARPVFARSLTTTKKSAGLLIMVAALPEPSLVRNFTAEIACVADLGTPRFLPSPFKT